MKQHIKIPSILSQAQLLTPVVLPLRQAGFLIWLCGGAVRDGLRAMQGESDILIHDFDFVTDAPLDVIYQIFPKRVTVGEQFGVTRVILEVGVFEIAQFRTEGPYRDGRRPTEVRKAEPHQDAARRDFTVNSLFYDPVEEALYDFVGGVADLQKKVLRFNGLAKLRIAEDYLRILRALRFTSQLGFTLEEQALLAIEEGQASLASVAKERVREELIKLFGGSYFKSTFENPRLWTCLVSCLQFVAPKMKWTRSHSVLSEILVNPLARADLKGNKDQLALLIWSLLAFWLQLNSDLGELNLSSTKIIEALQDFRLTQRESTQVKLFLDFVGFAQGIDLGQALGFWIEKSFDEGGVLALELLPIINSSRLRSRFINLAKLNEIKRLRANLKDKPKPLVQASDLSGLEGKSLGLALKDCYWHQLENSHLTKEELLRRRLV